MREGISINDKPEKCKVEKIDAVYDGDVFTIVNLTPVIHKDDEQDAKREVEERLYAVFSKYYGGSKP
jgi:hypothetical protein